MILADTNILLRLARRDDPEYPTVVRALRELRRQLSPICYTSQNIIELWRVVTRPKDQNGFGLTIEAADREARLIETQFIFLPHTVSVHDHWRRLVVRYKVSGRQVHDARLVAVMCAHGVSNLLTFNVADFNRYAGIITPVHPRDLAKPA